MSDVPTPVGSAAPQAMPPKGMHRPQPIVFSCPNGHRIVVDAALAGKKGRCKECKEIVTIPSLKGPPVPPPEPPRPPAPVERVAGRPASEATLVGPAAAGEAEQESRALHREPADGPSLIINEPAPPLRQAGGPAKTVIGEPLIEGESALMGLNIDPNEVQIKFGTDAVAQPPPQVERAEESPLTIEAGDAGGTTLLNPTARLMERLWYERRHGGVIEVHLTGAVSPILPTYFYPGWSDGSHGLFASLAADGTVTLTAVAWESVQKIVVRHVDSIPPDFLDIGLDE